VKSETGLRMASEMTDYGYV